MIWPAFVISKQLGMGTIQLTYMYHLIVIANNIIVKENRLVEQLEILPAFSIMLFIF